MARVMGVWGAGDGFSTGGLSARAQDMLESLAEWFYATEYIYSVPPSISESEETNFSSIFKLVYTS